MKRCSTAEYRGREIKLQSTTMRRERQVQQESHWIVNRESMKEGNTSCPNEPPTRLAPEKIEDEAAVHDDAQG